ncbi:N-acetyltransferase [Legionella sp. km772]|nr:N-acetyltransferase [Legionella sp. km772]
MLTTSRLIIYSPSSQDFNELYQLQSNPEVMRFIGNGIRTEEEVLQGLEKAIGHQKKHGFSLGSVFKKDGLEFVGRAGLIYKNYDDSQPEIEVAYALLPKYWKQGYAVELALSLINWAHTSLFISNIIGIVNPENLKSKKVLENTGMNFFRMDQYGDKNVEIWTSPPLT